MGEENNERYALVVAVNRVRNIQVSNFYAGLYFAYEL